MEKTRTFGSYVREKRLAAKVNLRKLAEILGIAPAYMSDIENDHRYPPEKEKIYQIAKKFRGERIKRKSKIPQLKIQNFKRR